MSIYQTVAGAFGFGVAAVAALWIWIAPPASRFAVLPLALLVGLGVYVFMISIAKALTANQRQAIAAGVAAFLGVVAWISAPVADVKPTSESTASQPASDRERINRLRSGVRLTQFNSDLETESVATLRRGVLFDRGGAKFLARDELFILDAAYVEAFVDSDDTVVGYTVTMRNDRLTFPVKIGSHTVSLGHQSVVGVIDPVQFVGSGCGARSNNYYETSTPSTASYTQTIAVGYNNAGALPSGSPRPQCPPLSFYDLPEVAYGESEDNVYVVTMSEPNDDYLDKTRDYRARVLINTASVTAPNVDLVPAMISLHPDLLPPFDPDPTSKR